MVACTTRPMSAAAIAPSPPAAGRCRPSRPRRDRRAWSAPCGSPGGRVRRIVDDDVGERAADIDPQPETLHDFSPSHSAANGLMIVQACRRCEWRAAAILSHQGERVLPRAIAAIRAFPGARAPPSCRRQVFDDAGRGRGWGVTQGQHLRCYLRVSCGATDGPLRPRLHPTPNPSPSRGGEPGRAPGAGHYVAGEIGFMNAPMLRPSAHDESAPATARQLADERSARDVARREQRRLGKGLGWYATFLVLAVAVFVVVDHLPGSTSSRPPGGSFGTRWPSSPTAPPALPAACWRCWPRGSAGGGCRESPPPSWAWGSATAAASS